MKKEGVRKRKGVIELELVLDFQVTVVCRRSTSEVVVVAVDSRAGAALTDTAL